MRFLLLSLLGLLTNLLLCDLFSITNPLISWYSFYHLVLGGL
jgi:hypothetical protein